MLGIIISGKEQAELQYLIKRELDELLFDLQDERTDHLVKRALEEKYKIIFGLFKRVAPSAECMKYMRNKPVPRKKDFS